MTCDHLRRLFALSLMFCATGTTSLLQGSRNFEQKALRLLKEEPQNPKCFAGGMKDFTCFWVEDEERAGSLDQYTFTYAYQNENSSTCPLTTTPASGGKLLFICHLKRLQMFVQMDIKVHREGMLIHNRSLQIELCFLLDPPANVTVSHTGQQGQLNVTWVPPPLKYKDDSMIYQVVYAPAESHLGQVEVARASSKVILRDLQSSTKYRVQVRVKLDGIAFNGYWSAWSEPVFIETLPAEIDPLIVSLTFIISFIIIVLVLITLLSHYRFLLKKVWPTIPTPDSKFKGLFTVYGGDFQEWLGHTSGGLWLTPAFIYSEECQSPLEVLSELSIYPSLPPKASKVSTIAMNNDKDAKRGSDDWRATSQEHWLLDRLRAFQQDPLPCSRSSMLESQDTYVALSGHRQSEDKHVVDNLEEMLPLEVLFASRKEARCESHSDLGSVQQNSGSGQLSSQSSFEYTNNVCAPNAPGYTYMAGADSGVSMDYSPMSRVDDIAKVVIYANEYKNEIPAHRGPLLLRQYRIHDDR
uniref:Erythropoietin receptor n=1 Tax=Oryzias latipes TaxID=8090 RepID=A0A3P9LIV0_ORYLA